MKSEIAACTNLTGFCVISAGDCKVHRFLKDIVSASGRMQPNLEKNPTSNFEVYI